MFTSSELDFIPYNTMRLNYKLALAIGVCIHPCVCVYAHRDYLNLIYLLFHLLMWPHQEGCPSAKCGWTECTMGTYEFMRFPLQAGGQMQSYSATQNTCNWPSRSHVSSQHQSIVQSGSSCKTVACSHQISEYSHNITQGTQYSTYEGGRERERESVISDRDE